MIKASLLLLLLTNLADIPQANLQSRLLLSIDVIEAKGLYFEVSPYLRLANFSSFGGHSLSSDKGPPSQKHSGYGKKGHDTLSQGVVRSDQAPRPIPPPPAWKILTFILCGTALALLSMVALGKIVDFLTKQKD